MKIEVKDDKAYIFTPYNSNFIKKVKGIGKARWNGAERCWTVPKTEIDIVRQFMMETYGETDQTDDTEKVSVKVTFTEEARACLGSIVLFGKTVATAFGRDTGAKIGDDVTLMTGKVKSGGSARNWVTIVEAGTVVKIRNVPKPALQFDPVYDIVYDIVEREKDNKQDKQDLIDEKERLLKRLEEIEQLLAG